MLAAGLTPLRAWVAVVLVAINLRTVVASLPPLLSTVRADLGLSAAVGGLFVALPPLCFGALAPVAPRLARRFALEHIVTACVLITAAGAALRAIPATPTLFAGCLVAGAGIAIAQAALPVLISAAPAPRRAGLMGAYSMALPLGATLGSAAAVPLEHALAASWSLSLAAWALPALLAAAVWGPPARRGTTVLSGPRARRLRGDRLAWLVAGVFGAQSMTFYAALAWLPSILSDHGRSAAEAGALLALTSLVSAAPALWVPAFAARARTQVPVMLIVVALPLTGLAGLLAFPALDLAWVVLIGLGQGGVLGLCLMLPALRADDPVVVASLNSMMLTFGFVLAAAGPWLLGIVHDVTGSWRAALVALLIMTVAELLPGLPATRARTLA